MRGCSNRCFGEADSPGMRVAEKALVECSPDRTHTVSPGNFDGHFGRAAARHHHRDLHLGRFDDHLAGQAPGGVEDGAVFGRGSLSRLQ